MRDACAAGAKLCPFPNEFAVSMPDTLASLPVDWDALDALKFADEEALLESLIKQGVLPGPVRDGAVRRAANWSSSPARRDGAKG